MRIEIISDASVFVERTHAVQLKSRHVSPPKLFPAQGEAATGLACIIDIFADEEVLKRRSRFKLCASASTMSSSEAEIAAGLLGFAFVWATHERLVRDVSEQTLKLEWRCDNEGVINSITSQAENEAVETKGSSNSPMQKHFFQLLESLGSSPKFSFSASQLAAAVQEPRQRNCDRVSRWLRTDSEKLYQRFPDGALGRIARKEAELAWQRVEFPLQQIQESTLQLSAWMQVFKGPAERFSEITKNS